jgi:hypothetical protein
MQECLECQKLTNFVHLLLNVIVCAACVKERHSIEYEVMPKSYLSRNLYMTQKMLSKVPSAKTFVTESYGDMTKRGRPQVVYPLQSYLRVTQDAVIRPNLLQNQKMLETYMFARNSKCLNTIAQIL